MAARATASALRWKRKHTTLPELRSNSLSSGHYAGLEPTRKWTQNTVLSLQDLHHTRCWTELVQVREKRPPYSLFCALSHETVRIPDAFSSPVSKNNWMGGTRISWLGANTSASTTFLWCIKMHIRAHVLKTCMDVPNKCASLGRLQNKLSLFGDPIGLGLRLYYMYYPTVVEGGCTQGLT